MKEVRVGLIGLGAFGERHLAALSELPGVRVTALCSRSAARAAELSAKYGPARHYSDFQSLVDDPEVDVVDVCNRDWEHVAPSLAALAAGKHLFLEKPIASSLAEAEEIFAAAARSDSIFMVGHILRFDERHLWLKQQIAAGALGKLGSLHLKRNISRRNNYTGRTISPILGACIHDLDLALWLTAEWPEQLCAMQSHVLGEEKPDVVWILLRFPSGAIAAIQTAWLVPDAAPRPVDALLEISGVKGTVRLDSTNNGVYLWNDEQVRAPETALVHDLPGGLFAGMLSNELRYFCDCVREGRPPDRVPGEDALNAFKLALLAIQSAAAGGKVMQLA